MKMILSILGLNVLKRAQQYMHQVNGSVWQRACKVRPYIVKWQSQEHFYNFYEDLGGGYAALDNKKVTDVNDNKRVTVKWDEIKMIRFEKSNPCKMLFKYRLLEPFQCHSGSQAKIYKE